MSLVSEECLNEWRMRNSWVYINFAYLFSNKIWKLRIPSGFSACPYFWVALFSMLVFKPVLEPVLLGLGSVIKVILKLGGAPFVWWDKYVGDKFADSLGFYNQKGIGLAITGLVLCILSLAIIALGATCHFYRFLAAIGPQWTALFWYVAVNFGCMIPTSIYIARNKHNDNRCKVEWYNLVCFIIATTVLSLSYPAMMATGLHNVGIFLFNVYWFLGECCKAIGHVFAVGGIFIAKYGWIALKFFGKWILAFILFMIPVLLICAAIGALGLLLMKLFGNVQEAKAVEVNKVRKVTPEDWKSLLCYIFDNPFWTQNLIDRGCFTYGMSHYYSTANIEKYARSRYNAAVTSLIRKIVKQAVDDLTIRKELLDISYTTFESLNTSAYSSYALLNWKNKKTSYQLLIEEAERLNLKNFSGFIYDIQGEMSTVLYGGSKKLTELFEKKFKTEFDRTVKEINKEIDEYVEFEEKERIRKAGVKKRHDEWCKMLSTPIARFFTSIFMGIKYTFRFIFVTLLWNIIVIKGICFTGRQIKIFLVYMWVVLKHLKHGACPYIQFVDPPVEPIKVEEKK